MATNANGYAGPAAAHPVRRAAAPHPCNVRRQPAPVGPTRRAPIVDRRTMLLLWLEEKIAQADKRVHDQGGAARNDLALLKDASGTAHSFVRIARDFGSWKGAAVTFGRNAAGGHPVTFKGWPNGRTLVRGMRYRVTHPRMIALQTGRPGLRDGAVKSARFGVYFVDAVDVLDYLLRDKATLGSLLGSLTVDIPGVLLASAVGAAVGSALARTAMGTALVVGSFAMGPIAVAFLVGLVVGAGLTVLDSEYGISDRLGRAYDRALARLAEVWDQLTDDAEARYRQIVNSQFVHDPEQNVEWIGDRIARQTGLMGGKLAQYW